MSRYLNTIIRHDFREHDDMNKVHAFLHDTAQKISAAYNQTKEIEFLADIYIDDKDPRFISFMFADEESHDWCTVMEFTLGEDYFLLDSIFDYWQLKDDRECGDYWLRNDNRFIAKALGQSELWLCEDSIALNGGGLEGRGVRVDE